MAADRNDQCPSRGPGLSHVQDHRVFPDGCCVHCGEKVEFVAGAATKVVCRGKGCINFASSRNPYCIKCEDLRTQHTNSHDWEGHSQLIEMCILCERLASLGAR